MSYTFVGPPVPYNGTDSDGGDSSKFLPDEPSLFGFLQLRLAHYTSLGILVECLEADGGAACKTLADALWC